MNKKNDRKHLLWRIAVFVIMITLTTSVFILLGSKSRALLIDYKYRFDHFVSQVEEKLYVTPKISSSISKINAETIPVLVYHGVGDSAGDYSITKNEFRNQMFALKNAGFQTVDDTSFIKFMRGEINLPEKSFLLTFDDGKKDSYYNADPILEKFGFNAVMFIATGQSLSSEANFSQYYLDKNEIERMVSSGRWSIGSHAVQANGGYIQIDAKGSRGYFLSNRMWLANQNRLETVDEYSRRVDHELTESKNQIKVLTGNNEVLFSYPFSDYGENSINAKDIAIKTIREFISKNYVYAFPQLMGADKGFVGNDSMNDPYLLKRVEIKKGFSVDRLLEILESSTILPNKPLTLQGNNLRSIFYRLHALWGNNFISNDNSLSTTIDKVKPNTISVLDGTKNWNNYAFEIQILNFNNTVGLYARMNEYEKSGVRCVWSDGNVSIEKFNNQANSNKIIYPSGVVEGDNVKIGISVKDKMIGCLENGKLIAATQFENMDQYGGVAIQYGLSSSALISSELLIDYLSIKESNLSQKSIDNIKNFETKSLVQDEPITELIEYINQSFETSPRYLTSESILPNDPSYYQHETYKNIIADFSNTFDTFVTNITSGNDGEAYWLWPEIKVSDEQEYYISASYSSNTNSELKAKFTMNDGSITWSSLKELPPSVSKTNYNYILSVPINTNSVQILQLINNIGFLSVSSPQVYLLKDGSFEKGMITLSFDDGRKTFIDNAFPLLEKYKYPATIAVITSHTGFKNYMNPKDLEKVRKNGDEIAVHTRDHMAFDQNTSYVEILKQIIGSWFDLNQIGYYPTTFVYPYGNVQDDIIPIISKRFLGARSIIRGFNTKNTDPYLLKDQLVDNTITEKQIKSWLDEARANKSWLILELHNVNNESIPNDSEGITKEQLGMILDEIHNSGLPVVTMNKGLLMLRGN